MKPLKLSGNMITIPIDPASGEVIAHSECAPLSGANVNLLTESEWRTIHNALVVYQCTTRDATRRQQLQTLMDKIRDEYIAPYQTSTLNL